MENIHLKITSWPWMWTIILKSITLIYSPWNQRWKSFSERGANTCSGRTPWGRGAHHHRPRPQGSWAAPSAWPPSRTAAHPWVPFPSHGQSPDLQGFGSKREILECEQVVCERRIYSLFAIFEPMVRVLSSQNKNTIHKHKVNFIRSEGSDCIWHQAELLICVFRFLLQRLSFTFLYSSTFLSACASVVFCGDNMIEN